MLVGAATDEKAPCDSRFYGSAPRERIAKSYLSVKCVEALCHSAEAVNLSVSVEQEGAMIFSFWTKC